jgi:hypothetical protein
MRIVVLLALLLAACAEPPNSPTSEVISYCTSQCQGQGYSLNYAVIYPNDIGDTCVCK